MASNLRHRKVGVHSDTLDQPLLQEVNRQDNDVSEHPSLYPPPNSEDGSEAVLVERKITLHIILHAILKLWVYFWGKLLCGAHYFPLTRFAKRRFAVELASVAPTALL